MTKHNPMVGLCNQAWL